MHWRNQIRRGWFTLQMKHNMFSVFCWWPHNSSIQFWISQFYFGGHRLEGFSSLEAFQQLVGSRLERNTCCQGNLFLWENSKVKVKTESKSENSKGKWNSGSETKMGSGIINISNGRGRSGLTIFSKNQSESEKSKWKWKWKIKVKVKNQSESESETVEVNQWVMG